MKKTIPALISVFIIVGMAVQSFATNVDFGAFVTKETFMTKYYEQEFLIDDIDREIERLYKFTCTNVKTFGGSSRSLLTGHAIFNMNTSGGAYHFFLHPFADLAEEGYLRFNHQSIINDFIGHGKRDDFYYEVPGPLVKWNDGVEPAENCKIRIDVYRTWPNTTSPTSAESAYGGTVTMGPFKKFKKFTTAGSARSQASLCGIKMTEMGGWTAMTAGSFKYASDTKTMPTTWKTDSTAVLTATWYWNNQPNYGYFTKTAAEIEAEPYSKKTADTRERTFYFNALPTTDFSQFTDFWIQIPVNVLPRTFSMDDFTITTWNHNK